MSESLSQRESGWMRTSRIQDKNGVSYRGRPIIGRDAPILGGVYLGAGLREAIVVDPNKYPDEFDDYYHEATLRAKIGGTIIRSRVLRAVYDTVHERMPHRDVERTIAGISDYEPGDKVTLNIFMKEGVGVCRHHALASAALLEFFKSDGSIRGNISVDRSEITGLGAHAWTRYVTYKGNPMALDATQRYLGPVEDRRDSGGWDYRRPDDK